MKLKEKVKSAKKFVKDHKVQFIVGGITVVAVVGGRYLIKTHKMRKTFKKVDEKVMKDILDAVKKPLSVGEKIAKEVDEQLFTVLAPEIEEMVLSEFCEDGLIDQTYKLANDITKQVVVTVKKV